VVLLVTMTTTGDNILDTALSKVCDEFAHFMTVCCKAIFTLIVYSCSW